MKATARSRNSLLANEKRVQVYRLFRSVKKARIRKGIRGTKTTLGWSRAKMMASMQKVNCEMGAASFAKNEKLVLQTLLTKFSASSMKVSSLRCREN